MRMRKFLKNFLDIWKDVQGSFVISFLFFLLPLISTILFFLKEEDKEIKEAM